MDNIITPKMFGQQLRRDHWSTTGLVFYWRGIPAGNVVDESPFGNDGTIVGPTWVGNGLRIDAPGEKISFSGLGNYFDDEATLIVVHKIIDIAKSGFARWGEDAGQNSHYHIGSANMYTDIFLATRIGGFAHIVDTTEIHQFAVTSKPGANNWIAYQNAVVMATSTGDANIAFREPAVWGRNHAGTELNSIINYMFLYDRVLSVSELQLLMLNPNLPMQQEPIWLFAPPVVSAGMAGIYYRTLMQGVA